MTQQSTQDQYPRDRFDDVERYTTQQGAHRKEFPVPKGAGQLNAIILAGGAALAVGIGSYLWLYPSDPLNQAGPESEETVIAPVDDEPQDVDDEVEELDEPEPVEEVEAPETVEVEEVDETPEPEEPSPEETEAPDEAVDYELPVGVYNASTIQGYAAQVAQELGSAGFNVPVADNWSGQVPAQTTVFYSDNEATARAVADEVGAVAVYEASVDGVLVVLTAD
ncbi:hypothetical protein GCM10023190_25430 [Enteractinococcus fodinae]|uniref:LytR/CpsA/Psr regulator C-terminal domain-containing protein n=1 Tax=Enteractinococcus fodinae TaxID=684663 RepID=A0ABU2B259_9MICC|nr:LytR C-terminal domain-containing protein [Enteractinococcus fodinae]MDR7347692.1 hypothetical protein [Enteractinococcus fodinae]